MKVTPRKRELAAILCSAMAGPSCNEHFLDACHTFNVDCMSDTNAAELARQALWSIELGSVENEWAEAEAKLRCGWVPESDHGGL